MFYNAWLDFMCGTPFERYNSLIKKKYPHGVEEFLPRLDFVLP